MQSRSITSFLSSGFGRMTLFGVLLGAGGCSNTESPEKAKFVPAPHNHVLVQDGSNIPLGEKEKLNRRLDTVEAGLYTRNLLDLHNELSDLYEKGYKVGMAVRPQQLLGKRLDAEVFPLLYNKMFLEGPDEVIVAEFTNPGVFDAGGDFGRGLRIIARKKVGELNISAIIFLDYNEKTKRTEFPQDMFYKERPHLVPDAMRTLIEYTVAPSKESLKSKQYKDDYYIDTGFIGATISAELEPKTGKVRGLEVYPVRDNFDEQPIGIDNKPFTGNASF